eukprot:gnl/TRDRNA2_/TRDRNA2_159177_c1_seq1.p1 gnl/TRDRNA2_/TRDRNA2_159177_c1~~gnl/TRDRNA2_/TRDRNA2_159177_c1_seq1.p1  ORF type:complete len:258 (-),score=46.16 gnl/TRDRNA2_/TRDRNA2_159177_c1_seq1:115-888(-)
MATGQSSHAAAIAFDLLTEVEALIDKQTEKVLSRLREELTPVETSAAEVKHVVGSISRKAADMQKEIDKQSMFAVAMSVRFAVPMLNSAFASIEVASEETSEKLVSAVSNITASISDASSCLKSSLRQALSSDLAEADARTKLQTLIDEHIVESKFRLRLLSVVEAQLNSVHSSVTDIATTVHGSVERLASVPKDAALKECLSNFEPELYDRMASSCESRMNHVISTLPRYLETDFVELDKMVNEVLRKVAYTLDHE